MVKLPPFFHQKTFDMRQSLVFVFGICMMFMTFQASAQIKLNPKVGVNISALDANIRDIQTEARAGWNVGLDTRIGEGVVFLNPGLHYYNYTAKLIKDINNPQDFENLENETKIQSVKLPVNIGINLTGDGGMLGIHALGGISTNYMINVKEKSDVDFNIDDLNRFTWGANIGVGVDVLFLTVNATYEIGLSEYFKDASGKNNMFTLSAGVKF